jgi:hypothetical protein
MPTRSTGARLVALLATLAFSAASLAMAGAVRANQSGYAIYTPPAGWKMVHVKGYDRLFPARAGTYAQARSTGSVIVIGHPDESPGEFHNWFSTLVSNSLTGLDVLNKGDVTTLSTTPYIVLMQATALKGDERTTKYQIYIAANPAGTAQGFLYQANSADELKKTLPAFLKFAQSVSFTNAPTAPASTSTAGSAGSSAGTTAAAPQQRCHIVYQQRTFFGSSASGTPYTQIYTVPVTVCN